MKFVLKGFFSIMLLLSAAALMADSNCGSCDNNKSCNPENVCEESCPDTCGPVCGKSFFSYRPQDSNVARRMVGVIDKTHLYGKEEFYGVFNLALQWQQTNKNEKLAQFLSLSKNCNPCFTYGPTCGCFDVYGLNFGTTGTNGAANSTGLCAAAAASTTSTGNGVRLNPRIQNFIAEFDLYAGLDEWVCGLWARILLPVVYTKWKLDLVDAGGAKATGTYPAGLVSCNGSTPDVAFATLAAAWENLGAFGSVPAGKYGKIGCHRNETALAGLHLELGYDFWRAERGFLGVGVHAVAPTGTRPNAELFFEPVAGANHSWQLGGTVQAGYRLWENCDGNQQLAVYFDSVITHLFGGKQRRIFGIKGAGAGSEYLLLKRFNAEGTALVDGDCLARASDLLAINTKIKAGVMADLALMLQYDRCNWSAGLGWNFWLRSKEKVQCAPTGIFDGATFNGANVKYGIKGSTLATNTDTQSNATIGSCGATDATPVFLTDADIDTCLALNGKAYSNKVFGFLGYTWKDCEWMPYLLVEGAGEFGHENRAASQWDVMLKGGISF